MKVEDIEYYGIENCIDKLLEKFIEDEHKFCRKNLGS